MDSYRGQAAGSEEFVLAIASGKPLENITLKNAYVIAGYDKDEGWTIEEYPEWENPDVGYWRPLPEPPEGLRGNQNAAD